MKQRDNRRLQKKRTINPGLGSVAALLVMSLILLTPFKIHAQDPVSLGQVTVPEPSNLNAYVMDKQAAIQLGKALFWDMQLGSDGVTACASCHFHAGTDNRITNTINPKAGGIFDVVSGPNETLAPLDFPFHKLTDPHERGSGGILPNDPAVISSKDDVTGAQGVLFNIFKGIRKNRPEDAGRSVPDPVFNVNGHNVRQVTGRNTPTTINAVFNYANFWDGRANHFFNGINPFGIQDVGAFVLETRGDTLAMLDLNKPENLIDNASLASQAVGPPGSDAEMSYSGRTFADIGKKMLHLKPLGQQQVRADDSVLGSLAKRAKGLSTSYTAMIEAAFYPKFWDSDKIVKFSVIDDYWQERNSNSPRGYYYGNGVVEILAPHTPLAPDEFTLMEANFSLFLGLAVQLYEATLVSDQTPFDRFMEGDNTALTSRQQEGLGIFRGQGSCTVCHVLPETTGATVRFIGFVEEGIEEELIELMAMGNKEMAFYDAAFYNIGVRPTAEDIGRGGTDPFGQPLSFSRQAAIEAGVFSPEAGTVGASPLTFTPLGENGGPFPTIDPGISTRVAVDGAFKTSNLRNIELTGPYMHNGSQMTLHQVVNFYVRGGDFHEKNIDNLDIDIREIGGLKGANKADKRNALVDFLISLTDERVRWEMAPFDHPQLFLPDGHNACITGNPKKTRVLDTIITVLPAVGALGRRAQGLPPIKAFLDATGDTMEWDRDLHFNP